MERIQFIFPNSSMHIVQDAGHLIHLEQPQALYKIVMAFLNEKN